MLNYKNNINIEDIDIIFIQEDLNTFEYIMKHFITYDYIFKDFETQAKVIQDVIMEEWGSFEQISDWQEDKRLYINNIKECINMLENKDYKKFQTEDNVLKYLLNNFNTLMYYFQPYANVMCKKSKL